MASRGRGGLSAGLPFVALVVLGSFGLSHLIQVCSQLGWRAALALSRAAGQDGCAGR